MESAEATAQLKEVLKNLGLRNDQLRSDDYFHNAGWYVASGEKIGYGDLSKDDLLTMSKFAAEPIILLYEHDSFWNFVKRPGLIGSMADVDQKAEQNPGADYVLDKLAAVVIPAKGDRPGVLYRVSGYREADETLKNGLRCVYSSKEKIKDKLKLAVQDLRGDNDDKEIKILKPVNELIEISRSNEIQKAKNALLIGKNVFVTGAFIVGKTSFAKYLLSEAEKGKVWPENAKTFYAHLNSFAEDYEERKNELKNVKLIVLDEAGSREYFSKLPQIVKELNENGSLAVASGRIGEEKQKALGDLFEIIELGLPDTASEEMKASYAEANNA